MYKYKYKVPVFCHATPTLASQAEFYKVASGTATIGSRRQAKVSGQMLFMIKLLPLVKAAQLASEK